MDNILWNVHTQADQSQLHEVTFAVRQRNIEKLESILYDVSTPSSPNYGKHWDRVALGELVRNSIAVESIKSFLTSCGAEITFESKYGEYIAAKAPILTWEKVFDTKFHRFSLESSVKSNRSPKDRNYFNVLRAKKYSLPIQLIDHVSTVFDVVHLPVPSRIRARLHKSINLPKKKGFMRVQAAQGYVSPQLINTQYGIQNNVGSGDASQGIYGALNQYASPTDLTLFQQYFNLPKQSIAYSYGNHVADGQCGTNSEDCMEANLDIQYIMAVARNVPTTYYYWDDSQDFMVGWMKAISSMENLAQIYSISYGADETAISSSYASQFNVEAAKLGILGVTLIVASGDDGALSSKASGNPSKCSYAPSFPATSPYVTAVGATMGPEEGTPEVACQAGGEVAITTGGGFSVRYSRPSYQDNAVRGYFKQVAGTALAPASGYNTNGRGLPDVSLLGHNYLIVVDKKGLYVDGTSASAPAFAGMVALLNSYRLGNGSSPMGWLNPALYATNGSFAYDITSGNNKCTSIYGGSYGSYVATCCSQGYTATPGWDPVTGFGSINFHEFIVEYSNITPSPIVSPSSNNSSGFLSLWSTKVIIAAIAVVIVLAGGLFYLLALVINRYCFNKNGDRSNRYQEANPPMNSSGSGRVPVVTALPAATTQPSINYYGFYAQPPPQQQRQNFQIDYGNYFSDVRPTVVTVNTRL